MYIEIRQKGIGIQTDPLSLDPIRRVPINIVFQTPAYIDPITCFIFPCFSVGSLIPYENLLLLLKKAGHVLNAPGLPKGERNTSRCTFIPHVTLWRLLQLKSMDLLKTVKLSQINGAK